ncbi:hypothetical protein TSAR_000114 [Trichomalopsis sarcophagae]|uniref:Uncharacterized protein n=1 Tax=Trichomalopsis sarcophagae TaxID=543379 RepID=A0A232EDC4_9HYME|nr:hypothetical protein TSAR_000114 [Trichomalopsis sarcophagae]
MTIVNSVPDLSLADREARTRHAREDVLEQFLFELKALLDHLVRSRSRKDLRAAITAAIEFEGKQSGRNASHTVTPPVKPTAQVRRSTAEEVDTGKNQQRESNPGNSGEAQSQDQKPKPRSHCCYCDLTAHAVDSCNLLIKHAAQKLIANPDKKNSRGPVNKKSGGGYNDNPNSGNKRGNGKFNKKRNQNQDISVVKIGELAPGYPYDAQKIVKVQGVTAGIAYTLGQAVIQLQGLVCNVQVVPNDFPVENSGIIGWPEDIFIQCLRAEHIATRLLGAGILELHEGCAAHTGNARLTASRSFTARVNKTTFETVQFNVSRIIASLNASASSEADFEQAIASETAYRAKNLHGTDLENLKAGAGLREIVNKARVITQRTATALELKNLSNYSSIFGYSSWSMIGALLHVKPSAFYCFNFIIYNSLALFTGVTDEEENESEAKKSRRWMGSNPEPRDASHGARPLCYRCDISLHVKPSAFYCFNFIIYNSLALFTGVTDEEENESEAKKSRRWMGSNPEPRDASHGARPLCYRCDISVSCAS